MYNYQVGIQVQKMGASVIPLQIIDFLKLKPMVSSDFAL